MTSIDAYLHLRRAVGFQLEDDEYLLRAFARWAENRDETHVRTETALSWAATARSLWQRERRLRAIAGFARHARAEDDRHEVPPIFVFARRPVRPAPRIYSPDELKRLLAAASLLPPSWPLRPEVFTTLLGILASTGLRVSEALGLRFGDVTQDGLLIRKTKFNKTRLVPLHPTVTGALDRYLAVRRRSRAAGDHVFVSPKGDRLPYGTVRKTFRRLLREAGIGADPGGRVPRIHDLRHTFAVRALEAAPESGAAVGRHVRALSTYLGHSSVAATCWYLHATPKLMRGVADACERFLDGSGR